MIFLLTTSQIKELYEEANSHKLALEQLSGNQVELEAVLHHQEATSSQFPLLSVEGIKADALRNSKVTENYLQVLLLLPVSHLILVHIGIARSGKGKCDTRRTIATERY